MEDLFLRKVQELYGESCTVLGPYIWKKNGRKIVDVKVGSSSKTMLYARLVLEVKLGRKLNGNETVDHKDEDPLNDCEDNLQPLSRSENARKSADSHKAVEWMKDPSNRDQIVLNASGSSNGMSKLSDQQVSDLRTRKWYHGCFRDWAKEFGVSPGTVSGAFRGKTYK